MRWTPLIATLLLLLVPATAAAAEPTDEAEARSYALVPPAIGALEFSLTAGALSAETAFDGSTTQFLLGASGGWMPTRWLELQLLVDHSGRRAERGENLGIGNTTTFVGIAPAFSLWFESLRFFAELGGGTAIRTASYDGRDLGGAAQVAPALHFGAGFGLALFGRIGFTMRGGAHAYEDRIDALFCLDISLFIGS